MPLPIVEHYIQLRDEAVSLYKSHKVIALASTAVTVVLVLIGIWAVRVRSNMLAYLNTTHKEPARVVTVLPTPILISSPSAYTDVLGTSEDITPVDSSYEVPASIPYPVITLATYPTPTPYQVTTTTTSSSSSCTGQPTVDNSQVYVTPKTTAVGSSASIEVDLQDCNNAIAPVSDTLTVTLVSGDSGTKINGSASPVTIETKNGKVTFSVTSSVATTATFLITDTTRSFTVTTPGYHNPSVTFTSGSTGSSGNANCTTSAGAPNTWYSDVYPNPPITTTTGSVTLQVVIRDCFQNTTTVNDALTISLVS